MATNRRWIPPKTSDKQRINRQIHGSQIRVVGDEGQIGIMDAASALKIAEERDLDLVEISPDANPPVCKIMDYGKFKFEKGKKLREARKKQATVTLKEIKMRPMIDTHDFEFKIRNARKFLEHGDKVKLTVRFRGRELSRQELGMRVLNRFAEELKDFGKVETHPKMEGRQMIMILSPQ